MATIKRNSLSVCLMIIFFTVLSIGFSLNSSSSSISIWNQCTQKCSFTKLRTKLEKDFLHLIYNDCQGCIDFHKISNISGMKKLINIKGIIFLKFSAMMNVLTNSLLVFQIVKGLYKDLLNRK